MDPINEIELEDCPVCRGAGYIEDEQGWCCLLYTSDAADE